MRPLPPGLDRAVRQRGRDLTLLVLRFGALGDVLRALPPVRLLRRGLPEARIAWTVDARWAPLLEDHADVDRVLAFSRERFSSAVRNWSRLPDAVRAWRRALRALSPDVALDFHGNLRSGVSAWLSGAPVRLGYAGHQQKEGNRLFTTHRVPPGDRRRSRMDRNLALVRALGVAVAPLPDGGLPIPESAVRTAESLARDAGAVPHAPYAAIAPGVSRSQWYKRPPAGLLAAVARRLDERGVVPIVVHGPGELDDATRVCEMSGGVARLAPSTDLFELAALLRGARVFVGGDTGPMHLACAVGCPVVALYGPTDPAVNSPWGVDHEAVFPSDRIYTGVKRRDRRGGFEGLSEAGVGEALERLLDRIEGPVSAER